MILAAHLILIAATIAVAWFLAGTKAGRGLVRFFWARESFYGFLAGVAMLVVMWALFVVGEYWSHK